MRTSNHPTRAVFRWAAIGPDAIVRYGGHAVWRSPIAAIAFFITTLIVADIFGFHIIRINQGDRRAVFMASAQSCQTRRSELYYWVYLGAKLKRNN